MGAERSRWTFLLLFPRVFAVVVVVFVVVVTVVAAVVAALRPAFIVTVVRPLAAFIVPTVLLLAVLGFSQPCP